MKATQLTAVLIAIGVALAAPAFAQEGADTPPEQTITHAQLARMLVEKLGLTRVLPANPSDFECIMVLAQNGIFPSPTLTPTDENPAPGWSLDPEAKVTYADLAVILVRALGLTDKVEGDKADIQNWVNVLKNFQIPHESAAAGIGAVKPLDQVLTALPLFQLTPDPLNRRLIPESEALQLLGVLTFPDMNPAAPPKPRPVTPV